MNVVHTMNVVHLRSVPDDRRERSRLARRSAILKGAQQVVDRHGLSGLTMQAVAEQLDCAVGTLYSYFRSKRDLVAGLQAQAVSTLGQSLSVASQRWDSHLLDRQLPPGPASVVRMGAFGAFWLAAAVVYGDEFALQRQFLATRLAVTAAPGDDQGGSVRRILDDLLAPPVALCEQAQTAGALAPGDHRSRALIWLVTLNAVADLDGLAPVDRHLIRVGHLSRLATRSLLAGWGVAGDDLEVAEIEVERLAASGPMAPVVPTD